MLLLGSRLIGTPVMSLQTGTQLAIAKTPLIDPRTLTIYAYELEGQLLNEHPSFIRIADIRELSDLGMIVDSSDEFVGVSDIIALETLYTLNFQLIGMHVVDEKKHRLGKVIDYTLDSGSFVIQQLNVRGGFFQAVASTGNTIHRSQITEINDKVIIVKSTDKKVHAVEIAQESRAYTNPFRNQNPQPNNVTSQSPGE